MTSLAPTRPLPRLGLSVRAIAGFGALWSAFGVYQFAIAAFSGFDRLVAAGLTEAQAALYANSPLWMDTAFALGTIGGTVGSLLLLAGRKAAVPVLAASLAGYVVLYAGDIVTGVFAAFGAPQVLVLSFVVLVAAGLWLTARRAEREGAFA